MLRIVKDDFVWRYIYILLLCSAGQAFGFTILPEIYGGVSALVGSKTCGNSLKQGVGGVGFMVLGNISNDFTGWAFGTELAGSTFPFLCYDKNDNVSSAKNSDAIAERFTGILATFSNYSEKYYYRLSYGQPKLGQQQGWAGEGQYFKIRLGLPVGSVKTSDASSGKPSFTDLRFSLILGYDFMQFHHRSCRSDAECDLSKRWKYERKAHTLSAGFEIGSLHFDP